MKMYINKAYNYLIERKTLTLIIIVCSIIITSCICYNLSPQNKFMNYLKYHKYEKVVEVFNEQIKSSDKEKECLDEILYVLDEIENDWIMGEKSYQEASEEYSYFLKIENDEINKLCKDKIKFFEIEGNGNESIVEAENLYKKDEFAHAMKTLKQVDQNYTQYDSVLELYNLCKNIIIKTVENPKTESEFIQFIDILDNSISFISDDDLFNRRKELEKELIVFKEVQKIIQTSIELFDNNSIKQSFVELEMGLWNYPGNEMLSQKLDELHNLYIIGITQKASKLCEGEKYSEALELVQSAEEIYKCDSFHLLSESIKEQKNILYKIKNDIVRTFNVFAQGWNQEKLDVKKLTSDAGSYVMKSGEKLFLGDYSNEDVTVLSFTGNMVASFANLDLPFDIRDLYYDVVNWGEDEYFALYLAADVVAVLPVLGFIKYLDYFKPGTETLKKASDLVDSTSDAIKNTDAIADVAKQIIDTASDKNTINEVVDEAINTVKKDKHSIKDLFKHYEKIPTINQKYKGKIHNNGVKYVEKKLKYSDGRMIKGVFPQFESLIDMELPKEYLKASFDSQKKYLLNELQKLTDPVTGNKKIIKMFTAEQLDDISNGVIPNGYIWHHNEKEGLMQLVDEVTHKKNAHDGGMSLWGKGY